MQEGKSIASYLKFQSWQIKK